MSATQRVVTLTAALMLVGAMAVSAEPRRGAIVVVPRVHVYSPFFYDPFWGPWYSGGYAYPYYVRPEADIRTEVTPKDAEVYVDGYYAGHADDFARARRRVLHEAFQHRDRTVLLPPRIERANRLTEGLEYLRVRLKAPDERFRDRGDHAVSDLAHGSNVDPRHCRPLPPSVSPRARGRLRAP